jgi:hypothetical protein
MPTYELYFVPAGLSLSYTSSRTPSSILREVSLSAVQLEAANLQGPITPPSKYRICSSLKPTEDSQITPLRIQKS